MCRDVGVTTSAKATLASASTMTDKPVNKAVSFNDDKPATVVAYTQTTAAATIAVVESTAATVVPVTVDVGTQSVKPLAIRTATVGVSAKPRMYDACMTAKPTTKHVGCSTDLLTDVKPVATAPVSVMRTTQTDTIPMLIVHARSTQTTIATPDSLSHRPSIHRTTQTVNDENHRTPPPAVVAVVDRRHRTTQTDAVTIAAVAVQKSDNTVAGGRPASSPKVETGGGRPVAATIGRRSNSFHHYTAAAITPTTPAGVVTSKIPRLKPVTPELNRKTFNRQDTYTKTAPDICLDHPPPPSPLPLHTNPRDHDRDNVK